MLGPAAFLLASAVLVVAVGVPYQRDVLAIWLLLGLLSVSLADVRAWARGVLLDWLSFIAVLIGYDSLRGSAGRLLAVHYLPQLQIDRWLFGGTVPTVILQRWLWHGQVRFYHVIFWAVYLSHFFATPLVAAVLWKLDRRRFRRFAVVVGALSFAGLATYALYPAAPPWMAAQAGLTAPLTRFIPLVWGAIGLHSAGSLVESGYRYANNVAAVPSLHAAFSLLIAYTLWPRSRRRRWLRPLVALYPLAMAFALVASAEHYLSDILLGWLYTVVVVAAVRLAGARWEARRARSAALRRGRGVAGGPLPESA